MKNIELKARCLNKSRAEVICRELGCTDFGTELQVDTYFSIQGGRLKLRDGSQIGHRLIYYRRDDEARERASDYLVFQVEGRIDDLRQILTLLFPTRIVVRKQRHVYLLGPLRVHLDDVEQLGSFIEFEYEINGPSEATEALRVINDMKERFLIQQDDIFANSYCDMLESLGAS